MVEFNPGKLPSNEYAFKNTIYIGQNDYRMFVEEIGKEPVYVKVKNFVMLLDQLHSLAPREFALSSLQKEAMKISKIDTITMEPLRIREHNPISTLELGIDTIHIDKDCDREVN